MCAVPMLCTSSAVVQSGQRVHHYLHYQGGPLHFISLGSEVRQRTPWDSSLSIPRLCDLLSGRVPFFREREFEMKP